jgi:hypothetical protein
MKTAAVAWQKRRSAFNHDWLKNHYLPALAKALNLLADFLEDPVFERAFPETVLPQWQQHRSEAAALLADFEVQMSPRRLLEAGPFAFAAPAYAWLADLVHALWLGRQPVRRWLAAAASALAEADGAYAHLHRALADAGVDRAAALRRCRASLAAFRDACQRLAHAIEVFPCEVPVT